VRNGIGIASVLGLSPLSEILFTFLFIYFSNLEIQMTTSYRAIVVQHLVNGTLATEQRAYRY